MKKASDVGRRHLETRWEKNMPVFVFDKEPEARRSAPVLTGV
jgi:hypothetical protein